MSVLGDEFNSYVAEPTSAELYETFAHMGDDEPALWSEPLLAQMMTGYSKN
jgi:hypothetical protein